MSDPVQVIGTLVSPYVRKVLVCLDLKGIAYQVDPVVAFFTDDRFTALSPLRRIPVLIDDQVTLCDSSVICQYLEDRYPAPALYPADITDRAQARWLEEYADTLLADVLLWRLFNEATINPSVWGRPRDLDAMARVVAEDVPPLLDYLESIVPADGFLFGALGIADISIAVQFRNAAWARFAVDAGRWPLLAAYVARVLNTGPFDALLPYEEMMMRTPVPDQRSALEEMGFPLTPSTLLTTGAPRRGPMTVLPQSVQ